MENNDSNPSLEIEQPSQSTAVDLGEDLFVKTAATTFTKELRNELLQKTQETAKDCYETAKILNVEGLVEEAKRFCRRALMKESSHFGATALLKEILEKELKGLLNFERQPLINRALGDRREEDSAIIIKDLDRDLKLNLFAETSVYRDFFLKPEDLERCLDGVSIQDRIDIAIALIGMELYELALVQLQTARTSISHFQEESAELNYRVILSLIAEVFLELYKPHDVIMTIQPVLRDADLATDEKIHFFYLMGRAHELLEEWGEAAQWYDHLIKYSIGYRDTCQRLSQALAKLESAGQ